DFLIYPEFTAIDDLELLKQYIRNVEQTFRENVNSREIDEQRKIPDLAIEALRKSGVFGAFVPREYGGLGMNLKDVTMLNELMSLDWSVYSMLTAHHLVSDAIVRHGTSTQKARYLPKLASGESIGAVGLFEDSGLDLAAMKTEVLRWSTDKSCLTGTKQWVINGDKADVLLVFAKMDRAMLMDSDSLLSCYIVDRNDSIAVLKREDTLGLKGAHVSKLQFKDTPVNPEMILGLEGHAFEIAMELAAANKFTYGAAVGGFIKRLIDELTAYCNKTFQFERTLAENSGIKKRLSDLCLHAYVLETMSYYIAGLRDEEWIESTDLENAIIHRYANRFLRDALLGAMEIVGSASATTEFDFERLIRDAMTLTALSTSDTLLTDQIAMDAITAWAEKYDVHLSEVRQPNENWWRTMRNRVRVGETLDKPKMRHYIAEHAHPSLEFACRNLEDTMGRVGAVMELLLERRGKAVEADHVVLENIADVVASNFAMLALISRSSRSYAIGLRNSDVEMRWATMFCLHAGFLAKKKLEEIMDVVNMTRYVPALTEIGATALNMEGYKLESPLERNW
uniref:Acyl-CoA dehydrogenase n=1 Tax=Plectus sambesii TaxID=2011161 RepID=A0A914XQR7_9BILA